MKAILFGSIGTISDTSELQRAAFNDTFRAHGLDWHWGRDDYREMLRGSGGAARIDAQARASGMTVDTDALHAEKSARFRQMLTDGKAELRPGVLSLIARARSRGVPVGLITTTARANVDAMLSGLDLDPSDFALITAREDVKHPKPAPDCYHRAAETLGLEPRDCIAIEDNEGGVAAAANAGMTVLAWPNANTEDHDFGEARRAGPDISEALRVEEAA